MSLNASRSGIFLCLEMRSEMEVEVVWLFNRCICFTVWTLYTSSPVAAILIKMGIKGQYGV